MAHIDTTPVLRASIWMRPAGDALDRIQDLINDLNRRCGGPRVQPHMTLLGGLETTQAEADSRLDRLAKALQPFPVEIDGVGWRAEYFRCFFLNVRPGDALQAARQAAHDVFEMNPPDPWEPHVSLLYGDLPERLKKELAAQIGDIRLAFEAAAVHLVNATADVPVRDWRALRERPLGR